jgi:zinc protease
MVGMPRSHVLSLWTLVFCLGLAAHAAAQPATTGPARLAVTEATLDNGLRVLIQEDPRNPIVAVQMFYRVGSRNELPGATGLAHFLEHMMFKGTPTRGRGEISRLIELNGGRDNAFTTKDMTGYHVNIAADRLDLVLTIEADRMRNLLLAPAEIDSERKVVMEERRSRIDDDPEGVVYEAMSSVAFLAHPYRWPIIGWMSDIARINPAELRAFYDTYYQPNNAILVIAGDVKAPDALALVRRHFGPIPRGANPAPVTALEPPQNDERRVIVRKEDAQLPVVNIAWHVPNFRSDDAPALEVLSTILSEGRASRLYRHLVYEKRMALGAGGEYSYSALDPTLFWFYATLLPGQTPEAVEQALLGEVEQLKKEPVPAEELERARNQIEASFVWQQDSVFSRASILGRFEMLGSWRLLDDYLPRIRKVTAADLQQVARRYFLVDRKNISILLPAEPAAAAAR